MSLIHKKSPSLELAEKISDALSEKYLISPEDAKKMSSKLSLGKFAVEDWRLAAEKAIDKGVKDE